VGAGASLVALATEARREALPNIIRLLPVARAAGVQVIQGTIHRRSDGVGANSNARLFASAKVSDNDLSPGSEGASVLPELGPEPEDLVLTRYHGVGPMGGTDLDAILEPWGNHHRGGRRLGQHRHSQLGHGCCERGLSGSTPSGRGSRRTQGVCPTGTRELAVLTGHGDHYPGVTGRLGFSGLTIKSPSPHRR
jgi:hypothetical protein